jgi:hypothetical protein
VPLPPSFLPVDGHGLNPPVQISKEHSHETIIGPKSKHGNGRYKYRAEYPTTFIYAEPPEGFPVSFLGTYSITDPSVYRNPNSTVPQYGRRSSSPRRHPDERRFYDDRDFDSGIPYIQGKTYHSSAPLDWLLALQVFYRESPELVEGILLHYDHGGSRVIGQVRLGVDASITITRPTHFVNLADKRRPSRARVKFISKSESADAQLDKWTQPLPPHGCMRFSFNGQESELVLSEQW